MMSRRPLPTFLRVLGALLLSATWFACAEAEDGPRVIPGSIQILAPLDGSVLGVADDVDASLAGLQLDVRIASQRVAAGVVLELTVAGERWPATAAIDAEGLATFARVTLPAGEGIRLVVTGPSPLRDEATVLVLPTEPTLQFTSPTSGAVISVLDDRQPAVPGIQLDVVVAGSGVPDGTPVSLSFGQQAPVATQDLRAGQVTFAGVTLPEEPQLTLVARAEVEGEPVEASITIALARYGLEFAQPLAEAVLTPADDVDHQQDWLQYDVVLLATGLGDGNLVELFVGDEPGLAQPVVDGQVTFPATTLLPGEDVPLVATGEDGGISFFTRISVTVEGPRLSFVQPLNGARLGPADDVDPELPGLQYDVAVEAAGLVWDAPVQLVVADEEPLEATVDGSGRASFPAVTLPYGEAVALVATATVGETSLRDEAVGAVEGEPLQPEIQFVVPEDGAALTAADDLDEDLLNGVQVEVRLATTHVENGQSLVLWVGGVALATPATVVNDVAVFESVTLPEAPAALGGVELKAVVHNLADEVAEATIQVTVTTGNCVVTVAPLPLGAGCDLVTDPQPATPEIEGRFVVQTNCGQVRLLLDGEQIASEELATNGGEAIFAGVPLHQGENTLQVQAAGSGDRFGASPELVYVVDTVRPTLGFLELAGPDAGPTPFALADALLPEVPGLQLELRGWVTDLPAGAPLGLQLTGPDGNPVVGLPAVQVSPVLDLQGRHTFLVSPLTLPVSGDYRLAIAGLDACGLPGVSPTYTLRAQLAQPTLLILAPAPEQVILASADLDPEAVGTQTVFTVQAQGVPAGETVAVRCGLEGGLSRPVVGTLTVPADAADPVELPIPVTLGDGWLVCFARYEGVNPADSPELRVLVAGTAPQIAFTSPRLARVATPTVRVAVRTVNVEDGQPVTLVVNGEAWPQPLVVNGGAASLASVPLQRGANELVVNVQDQAGNPASATKTIVMDDLAPEVTFVSPVEGATLTVADDVDEDPTNGLQVDVALTVLGVDPLEGATACLALDGTSLPPCPGAGVPVTGEALSFAGVRLHTGANVLRAEVRDGAGNVGTATVTVQVDLDAPVVSLSVPACLAAGAPVTVELQTDAADGAEASLLVDGLAGDAIAVADGKAVFTVELPADRDSLLIGRVVEAGRVPGFSAISRVEVWSSGGELQFLSPLPDAVINLATASLGGPGFFLDVRLVATGLAPGQEAELAVACGAADPTRYLGQVVATANGAELVFEDVELKDQSECTLGVESTNCAGFSATASAQVTVDRVAPAVRFLSPLAGAVLTFQHDTDPALPGMQFTVRVRVGGVPQGTPVQLFVPGAAAPLAGSVAAAETATFLGVTLPDGLDVVLRATASDPAGNEAQAQVVLAQIKSAEPTLAWIAPIKDTDYNAANDLNPAVAGFQQSFTFLAANLDVGTEVRLCSDNGPAAGAACSQAGYRVVGAALLGDNSRASIPATMLQGSHTVYGEARFAINQRVKSSSLKLTLDATLPTVAAFALTSDAPPLGVLNASEDLTPGGETLQASLEAVFVDDPADPFDGLATDTLVRLFTDYPTGERQLSFAKVAAGRAVFPAVSLEPGTHHLWITALDAANNPLAAGAPTITVVVDFLAPTVAFVRPVDGAVLNLLDDVLPDAGMQVDIDLTTAGASGGPLVLTVDGAAREPVPSVAGLMHLSAQSLPEGPVALLAELQDPAGNVGQAAIQVLADSVPPSLTLLSPEPNGVFPPDGDLEPARGGYQIDARVQVDGVPAGTPVQIRSSLGGVVVSDPATTDVLGETVLRCTLSPGDQVLSAQAVDEHGNPGLSPGVAVRVEVLGCGIYFAAPSGSSVLLGPADDLDEDPANGVQLDVRIVAANLACDGRQVVLLRDGEPAGSTSLVDGQAVFAGLTFLDGVEAGWQGQVNDGTQDWFTATTVIRTDLQPPVGSFLRPASSPTTLVQQHDLKPGTPGLQYLLQVALQEAAGGSLTLASSLDGELLRLPSVARPQALADGPLDLPEVTLTNGEHVLTVSLQDRAGNVAAFSTTVVVDAVPPTLGALSAWISDPRRPALTLSWVAPGDDGDTGGPVAAYEVRYASYPLTPDNFAAACPAVYDGELGEPGALQQLVLTGPGGEDDCLLRLERTYWLALRAIDGHGNVSSIAFSEELPVGLRQVEVAVESLDFGRVVVALGDVNGDTFPDVGVGSNTDKKAWILFGDEDLQQWTVQPIAPPVAPAPNGFGFELAGVGDVDGDGLSDFAIAAAGFVWLYLGDRTTISDVPVAQFDLTNLVGAVATPTVAAAGNFDGEGPADFVLGDALAAAGKGASWIVRGRPRAEWPGLLTPLVLGRQADGSEPGLVMASNTARKLIAIEGDVPKGIGERAALLGDFCGPADGLDDVALSGFNASSGTAERVVILCGRPVADLPADRPLQVADLRLLPSPVASRVAFGTRLTGGRDLTGDEVPDLVVSATTLKTLYLYAGGAAGVPVLHSTIVRDRTNFGRYVALPGDLDGDGHEDLGVAVSDTTREPNGLAPVYLGSLEGFDEADPLYTGEPGSRFGVCVAGPGDLDGDGDPDFVVGSPGNQRVILFH